MVMPQNLMEKSVGKQVSVLLKDGRVIDGVLEGYDEYMNMVLDSSSETAGENKRILGTVIVRGNNVLSISPQV